MKTTCWRCKKREREIQFALPLSGPLGGKKGSRGHSRLSERGQATSACEESGSVLTEQASEATELVLLLRTGGNSIQPRIGRKLWETLWPFSKAVLACKYYYFVFFFFKLLFFFPFGSKSVELTPTLFHSGNCLNWLCDMPEAAAKRLRD